MGDESLDRLRQAWDRDPGSLAFVPLGESLRLRGDLEEAIRITRSGLAHKPNHSSGHLVLGRCLFDKGEFSDAIREFEEVISLDSKNALALRLLGLALKRKGWSDDGETAVATRTERERKPEMFEVESRASLEHPLDIEFFTKTMGEIFERQGFLRKALEVYQRLLSAHPERADIRERIEAIEKSLRLSEGGGGGVS
jgi:tetratricopeptide (TPR) repeat protein